MRRIAFVLAALALTATARAERPQPFPVNAVERAPESALRARLRAHRHRLLDELHAYRVAGVFPVNTTVPGDGHFLIDPHGTLCAVANLIARDGHRDLIEAAARTNNALLFGDVHAGPIHDWILTSGFTQEEIARIQVPAPYVKRPMPLPELEPDPVVAANEKVSDYLAGIEAWLRANEESGLETAVARLSTDGGVALR
jgi:hypothetical protein